MREARSVLMEAGDRVYPMLLADLPDEVLEVWAQAVPLSPLGTVGARYADLLWERRFGDEAHRWARAAIDLYAQGLDERFDHPHVLMEMARRAHEVALMLNAPGLVDTTVAKMTELVHWSLKKGSTPGVALPLLEALGDHRAAVADLGELVDGAIASLFLSGSSECGDMRALIRLAVDLAVWG